MMASDNLVEISGLNFWYDKTRPILSGIDMSIPRGKVVSIMGISGSGKTTILRLIGGALKPRQGQVKVAGKVIHELDRDGLYRMRRRMGMLFQFGALFRPVGVR
jgi:phospholipid/cholesterol/gamma-HCH transport system ATP-binding protein